MGLGRILRLLPCLSMRFWAMGILFLSISACSHTTSLHTKEPGVQVEVNGKFLGETPLEYDEWITAEAEQDIVLTRKEQRRVLRVSRQPYSMQATTLGALFGASACCALNGLGCMIAAADVERNGVVMLATGSAGILGIVLGASAGFFQGRLGPDEIDVQFAEKTVQTWPLGRADFVAAEPLLEQTQDAEAEQKY